MKRLGVVICLVLAGFGGIGAMSHGVALAAAGGNADAVHACLHGGYLTLQGSDGTKFKNAGACVGYAARGGSIVGVSACAVTSTTGCLTFNNATLPSQYGTGNSITLTGSTSFVDTCTSGPCAFSGPNTLATGGGTYVETNSAGATISSGTYRVADTAGSYEGLAYLNYLDGTGVAASSCGAATGVLDIDVGATLVDGSTGATQSVLLRGLVGTLVGQPYGRVPTSNDLFAGNLTSSQLSITC